jgi:hypothetical protein
VANETMCRPIRALTEARGHATSKHMYGFTDHWPTEVYGHAETSRRADWRVLEEQADNMHAKLPVCLASRPYSYIVIARSCPLMGSHWQIGASSELLPAYPALPTLPALSMTQGL